MYSRFSFGTPATTLASRFDLTDSPGWTPRNNLAPTQEVLGIERTADPPKRQVHVLHWGLIRLWADDPRIDSGLINARSAMVGTKSAFCRAFPVPRRLILANGFYEWKGQDYCKGPFRIRLRDGRPFALAAMWKH